MSIAVETVSLNFLKSSCVVVTMVQGETQSRTLRFVLTQGETPIDLTGKTVTFYVTKPDGTVYFDTATVESETAAQGIAKLTLGRQAVSCFGWAKTELRVTGADGAVLKNTNLQIFVKSSKSEQSLESTSEFHALDAALALANNTADTAQQAVDTAAGLLQTADSVSQSAADTLAAAGNAVQAASDAAKAAKQRRGECIRTDKSSPIRG
ncbi:MAG: phage baseplate upper protein [Oscillospiraceae bacterium]|jgi:uncharacterized protein involved in tolerance to divalent cations|nr:phage baseplate upper protein [Oscillospiraceae bacterium]